jgi:predicted secreted protein
MDTYEAGRADDGKLFTLSLGDCLSVELEENPSSGYLWTVDSPDRDRVALVRSEFLPGPQEADGGGRRVLLFATKAIGEVHLSLKLLREWVGGASAIDRCAFSLQIRKDGAVATGDPPSASAGKTSPPKEG